MIPVNVPLVDGKEKELLVSCIETGWISSDGPYVNEFEEKFSTYLGARYGVAVCNGTAALEVALYAAGIGMGDEIIMPSFTIISCAVAALRLGAVPVLVDINNDTWNMDVTQIENKITSRTKAIMAVHMYGHPCDMNHIMEIAGRNDLTVVEDASQVHGATYDGRKCGNIGHVAAFSFYANKIITTGEGGMVITSDTKMAERAKSYRNLCFRTDRRFYHTDLGENFRMTNLQAAIGVAQMERIDEFVSIKRRLGERYLTGLGKIPGIKTQVEKPLARMVYWMYSIEITQDAGFDAETMMVALGKKGVGTRPFFLGLHEQPVLLERGLFKGEKYPITERSARYGLYLPSSLGLSEKNIDKVISVVAETMDELRAA